MTERAIPLMSRSLLWMSVAVFFLAISQLSMSISGMVNSTRKEALLRSVQEQIATACSIPDALSAETEGGN